MSTFEDILGRRSIRKYRKDPVSNQMITELLEAAMAAPSAGNQQPWHFIVIKEKETLEEIPKMNKNAWMVKDAPVAILICGDIKLEKHQGMWMQDCAAATENILIAAHARKLGAVWCGIFPREERIEGLRDLCNIPEHVIPFSLVAVGYPAEEKPPANRYDATRVHDEIW